MSSPLAPTVRLLTFVGEVRREIGPPPTCASSRPEAPRDAIDRLLGHEVQGLDRARLLEGLAEIGKSRCGCCGGTNVLWHLAEPLLLSPGQLSEGLVCAPEGLVLHALQRDSAVPSGVRLGESWEKLPIHLRRRETGTPPPVDPEGIVGELADVFGADDTEGLIALTLGNSDATCLRRTFRTRRPDGIAEAKTRAVLATERRIYVEVAEAVGADGTILHTRPDLETDGPPCAFTQVQLKGTSTLVDFLEQLREVEAVPPGALDPLLVLVGAGWNDVLVVWRPTAVRHLGALHRNVLARVSGGLVSRSVTALTTHVRSLRSTAVTTAWGGGDSLGEAKLVLNLRTSNAGGILGGMRWVREQPEASAATLRALYGLNDLVAEVPLSQARDIPSVAAMLWRGIAAGVLQESLSHLAIVVTE